MNNIDGNVANNKEVIIKVEHLKKYYQSGHSRLEVLKGVDLSIYKGEIVAIVGASGSGKSTLLNIIGGLDNPSEGNIYIADSNLAQLEEEALSSFRNKIIGFIFQFHHLLPDFTALENVYIPYLAHTFNKRNAYIKAKRLLREVKLWNRAGHKPAQLSGGEQQRVAVARSLINNPQIILADEPTGNLDEYNTKIVKELLWTLRDKFNLTIVLVTHNLDMAGLADRTLKLSYGVIQNDE